MTLEEQDTINNIHSRIDYIIRFAKSKDQLNKVMNILDCLTILFNNNFLDPTLEELFKFVDISLEEIELEYNAGIFESPKNNKERR